MWYHRTLDVHIYQPGAQQSQATEWLHHRLSGTRHNGRAFLLLVSDSLHASWNKRLSPAVASLGTWHALLILSLLLSHRLNLSSRHSRRSLRPLHPGCVTHCWCHFTTSFSFRDVQNEPSWACLKPLTLHLMHVLDWSYEKQELFMIFFGLFEELRSHAMITELVRKAR